jgi:hypothetical protein
MRLTRARLMLASALLAAGTVGGTVLVAAPASAGSTQVVLVNNCSGKGLVKPGTYDLPGCMPSSEYLTGLKWVSWKSVGYGSGQFAVNSCTPTCASGKYVKYPILTVLWGAKPWPKHAGQHYFSRLTVIFTGKTPLKHEPAAETIVLPATVP